MSRNIDQFNEVVGIIFAELYQSFPIRITLSPEEIAITKEDYTDRLVFDTIIWLQDSGYIRCGKVFMSGDFSQCTLTPEGLQVLNAIPESIQEKSASYGQLITEAAKDVAIEQGKKGLGELAAKVIAYGVTSLGNVVS